MILKLRKVLIGLHLLTLTTALLNYIVKNLIAFSLLESLELSIEVLTLGSGFILFFLFLKPFKKINLYFSIYGLTGLLVSFSLLFSGLFWVVVYTILFPIVPADKEFEKDGIVIYSPFQGIIASCCTYEVKERYFLIFEKSLGEWRTIDGPIDFKTFEIHPSKDTVELTYHTDYDTEEVRQKVVKR